MYSRLSLDSKEAGDPLVKSRPARSRTRAARRPAASHLERLEARTLLTVTIGGITIPGIPPGFKMPAFTNGLDLGSITSYLSPNPADYWWLQNTGQTLTNPTSGPATGTRVGRPIPRPGAPEGLDAALRSARRT